MARFARVIAVDTPHHVTQRGNGRQNIFCSDSERRIYLDLLQHYCGLHQLSLTGYCLMSNHVHPIVIPRQADSLATALKNTHGRYAAYWNAQHKLSGHVWQGRFYSCPLDEQHLWQALRYTELNPVRAGLVAGAELYAWSSAATHCGKTEADPSLEMERWERRWISETCQKYLTAGSAVAEIESIRESTHTGRPLGTRELIEQLERESGRLLAPQKGGRPHKPSAPTAQSSLEF